MASKNELYAEIVNGETQRFRDEISVQGAQLADRRSREIESAATPKEGAAIATAALNEMVKDLSEILQRGIETKAHPTFEWLRRRVSQLASPELDTPQPRREDFLLRVRHKTLIEKARRRYCEG
jgi:hypothetical protein